MEKQYYCKNRPNPFRNETLIGFELPNTEYATFRIMDLQGRILKSINGILSQGYHEVYFSPLDLENSIRSLILRTQNSSKCIHKEDDSDKIKSSLKPTFFRTTMEPGTKLIFVLAFFI